MSDKIKSMEQFDDEEKKKREDLQFAGGYEPTRCPVCERVRVSLRKNGHLVCEKCEWDQTAGEYTNIDIQ